MRNNFSSIDDKTGNVTWQGPLSIEKGNHNNMPSRSDAYIAGYERGHVNASSLGGDNTLANIVPQHRDLNHGAYYSMEQGERITLRNGASIDSTKVAVANGNSRPEVFMVTDKVTYEDGHIEMIHHSFTNASNAEQQLWNEQIAALDNIYEVPNPANELRNSMSTIAYSELMEDTNMILPNIVEEYEPTTISCVSEPESVVCSAGSIPSVDSDTDAYANNECAADCDVDV